MPVTGIDGSAAVDPVASLVTALNAATTALSTATSSSLQKASNLSDVTSPSTSRTSLGLGTSAVMSTAQIAADSALTNTFVKSGGSTAAAALFPQPFLMRGATIDSFIARPNGSDTTRHPLEWRHDDVHGDLIHLTTTSRASTLFGDANLIALGIDANHTGIYVHNRSDSGGGIGINISMDSGITATNHYGMIVNGGDAASPAVWMQQNAANNAASVPICVFLGYQVKNAADRLVEFRKPSTATPSTGSLAAYVQTDGSAVFQSSLQALNNAAGTDGGDATVIPFKVTGISSTSASLTEWAISGTGTVALIDKSGNGQFNTTLSKASGTYLGLYDTGGTVNSRRFHISQSSGSMLITARNDDSTNKGTVFQISNSGSVTITDAGNIAVGTSTGTKIGTATSQKLGFFNATPVIQRTAAAVTTGYAAGASTAVTIDGTFTGNTGSTAYTIGDVVNALKSLGLVAA